MITIQISNKVTNISTELNLLNNASYRITKDADAPAVYISEGVTVEDALRHAPYTLNRCLHINTGAYGNWYAATAKKWETAAISVERT